MTLSGLSNAIPGWKSMGLLNEQFIPPYMTNKSLSPKLIWYISVKNLNLREAAYSKKIKQPILQKLE